MPTQPLVPDPRQMHLLGVVAESASIELQMRTCSASAPCPVCGRPSRRVHSWYRRTLVDCLGLAFQRAFDSGPAVSFVTRPTVLVASSLNAFRG